MLYLIIELVLFVVLSSYFVVIYKKEKCDKLFKILYILFWTIIFFNSFVFEKNFFIFDMNSYKWKIYFFLKLSFLIFIVLAAKYFYDLSLQIVKRNITKIHLSIVSLIYFTFCMIMLIFYYPGSWKWDEIWILYALDNFVIGTSQHFLTSVLYSWGIMIFGSPVGIIILINALISIFLGYCASEIRVIYKTNKSMIIFIIPFMILPPVIDNNMYPLRHSLYAYLCMLLFLLPIIDIMKKRNRKLKIFTIRKIIGYIVLITLVSVWRNEGIYYIVFPIVLLIFFRHYITPKKKLVLLLCPIICAFCVSTCQQRLSNTWNPDRNTIIVTLNLFYDLMESGQLSQHEINDINKVLDVKKLKEEGVNSVWNGLIKDGKYSPEEFSQLKKIYILNVLKHPLKLAKIQWPIFKRSNGNIKFFSEAVFGDVNIYNEEFLKTERGKNYIEFLNYPGIRVISENFRDLYRKFILLLKDTTSGEVSNLHRIVYSCYFSIIVTIIYAFVLLIKKETDLFVFVIFSLGRLPIVFFTSPDSAFMYYYPNYIIGIVVTILILNNLFQKSKVTK